MDETAVPLAMPPPKRGSYFARHWRGDLSLPKSYWLNGALLFGFGVNLLVLVGFIVAITMLAKTAALAWTAAGVFLALELIAYVWALVGTWRSAGNYKGPAVWKVLARIAMVLGIVLSIRNVAQTLSTVQQATEAAQQGLQFEVR